MSVYDEFARIAAARQQWHDDLARANRESLTGTFVDELFARADDLDAQVEQLRRQYFPRAHRLVVTTMGAMTTSPTGRSIRLIWEPEMSAL